MKKVLGLFGCVAMFAATAHAHGATVYTRNATDLTGLEELVEIVAV